MSFIVPPPGDFGEITEMASYRRMRRTGLPPELADQVRAAGRLADDLEAAGVALRFREAGPRGGRLRAVLTDEHGNDLCEVSLAQVVSLELPI